MQYDKMRNVISATTSKENDIYSINKKLHPNTQFIYLHKFFFGGVTTFTAHLFYTIGITERNKDNVILHLTNSNRSENRLRDFGYGLHYRNISAETLSNIQYPFFTMIKDDYFPILAKLIDNDHREQTDNAVVVIHDPRDLSNRIIKLIKKWKIITIRRSVQDYIQQKYNLNSLFLYHPFYPYSITSSSMHNRKGAVSISRIGFGKNIDIILKANKILESFEINGINLYGCPTPMYVYLHLNGKNDVLGFKKYYHGKFNKSFSSVSNIISKYKFVVDLSLIKNDGGGTQYTYLEAIHNDCALILHRRWLKDLNNNPKYCDFKEGYNCFAIDNENELAELIKTDPDTSKIVKNAKKLMRRHIHIDWSKIIDNN
jgi:hypothetical protein